MIICGSWGGMLLVWTKVYKLCLMWSSKDDLPVTWPYPLALQNLTGQGEGGSCNGNQPLHQETLLPHSTAAEARWWGTQKSKDKRGRGTCELPQDWWVNLSLHHSAKQLGICSVGGRVGVGDKDPGSRLEVKQ